MRKVRVTVLKNLFIALAMLLAALPAVADISLSDWIVRKGNTIEVLGPDESVDLAQLVEDIQDAGATNRYLIQLGPGTYNVPGKLLLKEYVDLRGSGQDTTEIVGDGSGCVVEGVDNSVLSDLTVTQTAGAAFDPDAVCNQVDHSPTFRRVTTRLIGAPGSRLNGFRLRAGSPRLTDVTAVGENGQFLYGIRCVDTTAVISNARVELQNASERNRGFWVQTDCELEVTNLEIVADEAPFNSGIEVNFTGKIDLKEARIRVTGAGENVGVLLLSDAPEATLDGVVLRASGGTGNSGIEVLNDAFLRLFRSSARGSTDGAVYSSTVDGFVSQSTIFNGVAGTGTLTCVASDNGQGKALASDCSVVP